MKGLTEHEMTVAVDAAARALYEAVKHDEAPDFAELHPLSQNEFRQQVMTPVLAAIEATPDRAEALRLELRTQADVLRGHGHRTMSLEQLEHLIKERL